MDGEQDYTDSGKGQYDSLDNERQLVTYLQSLGFASPAEPLAKCCFNCKFWREPKGATVGTCWVFDAPTKASDLCNSHKEIAN